MTEPSLTKLMIFVQADDNVPVEEFRAYWRSRFFGSIQQSALFGDRLVRAIHNHILPGDIREDAPTVGPKWSGIGSYWLEDRSDKPNVVSEPEFADVLAVHKQMIPMTSCLLCKEVLIFDKGMTNIPVKMIAFFKRLPTLTREAALTHYRGPHAALADDRKNNTLQKYVQNHALLDYVNPDRRYDYDGGPEIWFKSMADAELLYEDEGANKRLAEDEDRFVIRAEMAHFWVEEELIFDGRA